MDIQPKVTLEIRNGLVVLHILGDLTVAAEHCMNQAYADACEVNPTTIVLEFTPDAYINSGGIAILLQMLAQTRDKGQRVIIAGLSEHFKKIFRMVGIHRFVRFCESVNEAAAGLDVC